MSTHPNLEAPNGGFLSQTGLVKSYQGIIRAIFHLEKMNSFFLELSQDRCIYDALVKPLTKSSEPMLVSANYWGKPAKVGSHQPWHQDLAYLTDEERTRYTGALTIWIALEDANQHNGCLEFYPCSHKQGYLAHPGNRDAMKGAQLHLNVDALFPNAKPIPVKLSRGSAVCFDGYTIHASKKNTSNFSRQAISLGYVYT